MSQVILKQYELSYGMREELKSLRTNIQLSGAEKRVLLFTSVLANEGKTTVVMNLARTFASQGKRVLVVDADLRKSILKRSILTGHYDGSLTRYLAGQCELETLATQTETANLDIIFAGSFPPNPSELLSHPRMRQLIQWAEDAYDYIFLDTAPLGLVTDPAVLAPLCDGALLVIESNKTPYKAAQFVVHQLKQTRCPILGVVLNQVNKRGRGRKYGNRRYYAYASKKYYEYY